MNAPLPTRIKRFHHFSLAVNNAAAVIKTWEEVLGIGPWTCLDMGGEDAKGRPWKAKEYWTKVGDTVIELIEPVEGRIVQSKFLDTVGPGLHHIAFEVENVDEAIEEFKEKGAELIIQKPGSWAYFRTGGPDGAIVEVSQHSTEPEDDPRRKPVS